MKNKITIYPSTDMKYMRKLSAEEVLTWKAFLSLNESETDLSLESAGELGKFLDEIPGLYEVVPAASLAFLMEIYSEKNHNLMLNFTTFKSLEDNGMNVCTMDDIVRFDGEDWYVPDEASMADKMSKALQLGGIEPTSTMIWSPFADMLIAVFKKIGNNESIISELKKWKRSILEAMLKDLNPIEILTLLQKNLNVGMAMSDMNKNNSTPESLSDFVEALEKGINASKPDAPKNPATALRESLAKLTKKLSSKSSEEPIKPDISKVLGSLAAAALPPEKARKTNGPPQEVIDELLKSDEVPEDVKRLIRSGKFKFKDFTTKDGMGGGVLEVDVSDSDDFDPELLNALGNEELNDKPKLTPEAEKQWMTIDKALWRLRELGYEGMATISASNHSAGMQLSNFAREDFESSDDYSRCLAKLSISPIPNTLVRFLEGDELEEAKRKIAVYTALVMGCINEDEE